jgi:hypothetical protein
MKRRAMLAGLAVAAAGLAGTAAWKFRWFAKSYPPSPYDDLLGQIVDREPAAAFGRVAAKSFADAPALAADLRRTDLTLNARAAEDPLKGRVAEVQGWLVPQSVAQYAALAAWAARP